jgi:hypothetical protein
MNWDQLAHVLRASAAITQDTSFVVIGSQAVLLSHPNAPAELLLSKCVAGPDKDAQWVAALLRHGMIELPRFIERLQALDAERHDIPRLVAWAHRRAQEAAP